MKLSERIRWWREARYGMFLHWGLYSLLGRNEWALNREKIPASEYEPEPATAGKKDLSSEEKEDQLLRERVRGDETLRRAVDVLLGLKALNIRGVERAENPAR